MKELLLLKLRNAIAQKEAIIANMNMETTHHGGWSCNWNQMIDSEMQEITSLLDEIEALP